MMIEIGIIGLLLVFILFAQGKIDGNKFIKDNEKLFKLLKEDDYDFLVAARYGDGVDANALFEKRVKDGLLILVLLVVIFIANLNFLSLVICFIISYLVFKNGYTKLKGYYKKHLHEIELIGSINAGDSTIDPYMAFAIRYPVRDSMRMMRLLYRLGLGNQERKQEQLIMFSRTISSLQSKSRDMKYKERLEKMERKTMVMLSTTGAGVMVILVIAILQMFSTV